MRTSGIQGLVLAAAEIREMIIRMGYNAGTVGAHFGGSLSCAEILAVLYMHTMNISPDNRFCETRDRFILSKGHGSPALYSALHLLGMLGDTSYMEFKKNGSSLSAHPSVNSDLGIEFSSGSLGQGLSLGVGSALGLKRKKNMQSRVFVLLGDGECDEGSVWEAAMSASHFRLDNLVGVVDSNGLQQDGATDEIMGLGAIEGKFLAFGWETLVVDGHSVRELVSAFDRRPGRPLMVIAKTVKGKGISFMEGNRAWHHSRLSSGQFESALAEVTEQKGRANAGVF